VRLHVSELFRLPGPARYLADLTSIVRDGKSLLLPVPRVRGPDVALALAAAVEAEGYPWDRVDSNAAGTREPLAEILWSLQLEDQITGGDRLKCLLVHEKFRRCQVLIGALRMSDWPAWERFLLEFEIHARAWEESERPRFALEIVMAPGERVPTIETPLVTTRPWIGRVHDIDMRVHVTRALLSQDYTAAQRQMYVETVCALSLWDFDLADFLLERTPEQLSDPIHCLRDYGVREGWDDSTPADWALGTENRFEDTQTVHSSWAAQHNQLALVDRRIWEAQARVVLPMLDRNRCALVHDIYPRVKMHFPDATKPDDLYGVDFGELAHALGKQGIRGKLLEWAHELRLYRNKIAHLQVLSFSQLFHSHLW
jgi:hypothetical protein